jgi:hypothetical protein
MDFPSGDHWGSSITDRDTTPRLDPLGLGAHLTL